MITHFQPDEMRQQWTDVPLMSLMSLSPGKLLRLLMIAGIAIIGPDTVSAQLKPPATSAQKAATTEKPLVRGHVEDSRGEPVAGAKVLLIGSDNESPQIIAETLADDNGEFRLPEMELRERLELSKGTLSVFAEHVSAGIGWLPCEIKNGGDFTIELVRVDQFRGRLLDEAGEPIAGAAVEATGLGSKRLGSESGNYLSLPLELRNSRLVTTDETGTFVLAGLPSTGSVFLEVKKAGLGTPELYCNLGSPLTATLQPAGELFGKLTWPDGTAMPDVPELGTIWLSMMAWYGPDGKVNGSIGATHAIRFSDEVSIASNGSIGSSLPPGQYHVYAKLHADVPPTLAATSPITVAAGEVTKLTLTAKPATKISGRVVSVVDDSPVAGCPYTTNGCRHGCLWTSVGVPRY